MGSGAALACGRLPGGTFAWGGRSTSSRPLGEPVDYFNVLQNCAAARR